MSDPGKPAPWKVSDPGKPAPWKMGGKSDALAPTGSNAGDLPEPQTVQGPDKSVGRVRDDALALTSGWLQGLERAPAIIGSAEAAIPAGYNVIARHLGLPEANVDKFTQGLPEIMRDPDASQSYFESLSPSLDFNYAPASPEGAYIQPTARGAGAGAFLGPAGMAVSGTANLGAKVGGDIAPAGYSDVGELLGAILGGGLGIRAVKGKTASPATKRPPFWSKSRQSKVGKIVGGTVGGLAGHGTLPILGAVPGYQVGAGIGGMLPAAIASGVRGVAKIPATVAKNPGRTTSPDRKNGVISRWGNDYAIDPATGTWVLVGKSRGE